MKSYLVAILAVASFGFWGCTGKTILYKPSPYIDPMPLSPDKNEKVAPDPLLDKQWNLKKIGISNDLLQDSKLAGNANVKMAILSTGIDYNHKDLVGQVMVNKAEISQKGLGDIAGPNLVDDDANGLVDDIVGFDVVDGDGLAFDRHGAGTAVAGILAARVNNGEGIAGMMRDAGLYPIRYINENGQSSATYLIAALEVAAKVKPDVVFLQSTQIPIGDRKNPEIEKIEISAIRGKLKALKDLAVPIVIGAGDDMTLFGEKSIEKAFMSYDNVIVVTASDEKDQLTFLANQGFETVHIAAPGEEVLSTDLKNAYANVQGSAVAAAHVAGLLGLAKAKLGEKFDLKDVVTLLSSAEGSDQVDSLAKVVRNGSRLNVPKFLGAVGR